MVPQTSKIWLKLGHVFMPRKREFKNCSQQRLGKVQPNPQPSSLPTKTVWPEQSLSAEVTGAGKGAMSDWVLCHLALPQQRQATWMPSTWAEELGAAIQVYKVNIPDSSKHAFGCKFWRPVLATVADRTCHYWVHSCSPHKVVPVWFYNLWICRWE